MKKMETGNQVIVMIDANKNVLSGNLARKMTDLGLSELICKKHGSHHSFLRGSEPIDGIFVSPLLADSQCGYVFSGCDHYGLWIDILNNTLLGLITTGHPLERDG
jgi:hypothetical protein